MTVREKLDFLENAKEKRKELIANSNTLAELELLKQVVKYTKEVYGDKSNNYISVLNELGGCAKYVAEYDLAISSLVEARDIIVDKFGDNSISYATTLLNLSEVYRFKNELDKLEKIYLKVLEIYNKYEIYEKYEYASVCNNLGLYYQDIERYENALKYHLISLEIMKKDERWKLPLATTYNNLAIAYRFLGQIEKSDESIKKCLKLYEEEVGKGHAMYSAAVNNLAVSFFNKGDLEKSLELFNKVLFICEASFGKNSANYLKVKENVDMVKQTIEMSK